MTTSINGAAYVPEISAIEGDFFTDIEAVLSSMTKPTGKGSSEKPAVLNDEAAAKYADDLGSILKSKFFNTNDLVLLKKSFEAEKNSATFNFDTVINRANLYGRDADPAAVAPPVTDEPAGTDVAVVVNVNGGTPRAGTTTTTPMSNTPALSPLAQDIYGAIQSMSSRATGFRRGIETGDINQYSIGTAAKPGAYAKLMADAAAGRGIVVDDNTSRTDLLRASVEVLTRMLQNYQEEVQDT